MRRHKHLFEQVVSFDNLLGAARDALRGRRLRQPMALATGRGFSP